MRHFGLIGHPVAHSASPAWFVEFFRTHHILDAVFGLFDLEEIRDITTLLNDLRNPAGLLVTIPYKSSIIPYLNELDSEALAIGSVNTISINRINDKYWLKGFNTDWAGFRHDVSSILHPEIKTALVFGNGGAAKAICFALTQMGIEYKLVSRNPKASQLAYKNVTEQLVTENLLLINTTPLGMHPYIDDCINIPYQAVGKNHVAYDLVYNPSETRFLAHCREQGAATRSGSQMLYHVLEASWKIWNSK